MLGCSVDLDLSEFFDDIKKYSSIYLDFKQCKLVRDAEMHIRKLFNITEEICLVKTKLMSDDVFYFPSDENVRLLLSTDSTIQVKVLPLNSVTNTCTVNNTPEKPVEVIKTENIEVEESDCFFHHDEHPIKIHVVNMDAYQTAQEYNLQSEIGTEVGVDNFQNVRERSIQTDDICSCNSISLNSLSDDLNRSNLSMQNCSDNSNNHCIKKVSKKSKRKSNQIELVNPDPECDEQDNTTEIKVRKKKKKTNKVSYELTDDENVTFKQSKCNGHDIYTGESELIVNKNNNYEIEGKNSYKKSKVDGYSPNYNGCNGEFDLTKVKLEKFSKTKTYNSVDNLKSGDSLNAIKESLIEQIDEKISQELEQPTMSRFDYATSNNTNEALDVNVLSVEPLATECSDQSVTKKRKRKRKHNKKYKAEKLLAAANLLETTEITTYVTSVTFPRSKTHKFFTDNDVNEDRTGQPSREDDVENNTDMQNIPVSETNDQDADVKIVTKLINNEVNNSNKPLQTKWDKMSNQEFCNQGLISLLNEAKATNKTFVFNYVKPTENKTSSANTTPRKNDQIECILLTQPNHKEAVKEEISIKPQISEVDKNHIVEHPEPGQVVKFKMLRISENYQPEISKEIVARILSVDSSSAKTVTLKILRGIEEFTNPNGKFSLDEEEEEESYDENKVLLWSSMLEPRLCYS